MRITTIGFGYTKSLNSHKNLGNYESCKVYLEAQLEPGEDSEEAMTELRNQVAQELDLPDQWHDLERKLARQVTALEKVNEKLQKAEKRWERYAAFLAAHGVNPDSITINSHPDSIAEADQILVSDNKYGDYRDDYYPEPEEVNQIDEDDNFSPHDYYPESDQIDKDIPFAMPEF